MKILIVLTSHDQLGNTGVKTGLWYEELAAPYYVFTDAGHEGLAKGGQAANRPQEHETTIRHPGQPSFRR